MNTIFLNQPDIPDSNGSSDCDSDAFDCTKFSPREDTITAQEEVECEICASPINPDEDIILSCKHTFCETCVSCYIKIGPPSSRLTFHHIYCPFRCGTCFVDSHRVIATPTLCKLVHQQLELMQRANSLAYETMIQDSDVNVSGKSHEQLKLIAMEKYPIFQCAVCEDIFVGALVCCEAADASNPTESNLCSRCKSAHVEKKSVSQQPIRKKITVLSLWDRVSKGRDSDNGTVPCEGRFADVCDTDDNAFAQASEIEAMISIYSEELTITTPAPDSAGMPCAAFTIIMPKLAYPIVPNAPSTQQSSLKSLGNSVSLTTPYSSSHVMPSIETMFPVGKLVKLSSVFQPCNDSCIPARSKALRCIIHGPMTPEDEGVVVDQDSYHNTILVRVKTGKRALAEYEYKPEQLIGKDTFDTNKWLTVLMSRLADQLSLVFRFPRGYPESAAPVVSLSTGDLSMQEFDLTMRRGLIDSLVSGIEFAGILI